MMQSLFSKDMMKKVFCQGYLWLLLLLLSPYLHHHYLLVYRSEGDGQLDGFLATAL